MEAEYGGESVYHRTKDARLGEGRGRRAGAKQESHTEIIARENQWRFDTVTTVQAVD